MTVTSRSIAVAAVGVFSAAVLAASVAPATAAPAPAAAQNHAMGSTIRAHEGTANEPKSPAGIDRKAARLTDSVQGIDVASYQGNVDWAGQWNAGKRFVWVKATEGTGYTNPYFDQQYGGSYNQGFIRGAYHFARPSDSSGAAQATYFLAHGGGWTSDGKTLPGALDMEYAPSGGACWGLTPAAMGAWIKDFSDTYKAKTNKYPAVYTSASWFNQCVAGNFASTNPLWVARYASAPGSLPTGWGSYTVWQYSDSPMDQDVFNGSAAQLATFATNHD